MTLQQLEYVVSVDVYRNFVAAAEACGVTQSTLSLMIKKLEEELDVKIFDRDSHPVKPTTIGEKIISKAKGILFNANQLVEMTRSEKSLVSGDLRIGMISTVSSSLMPGILKSLRQGYPKLHVLASEIPSINIKERLKKAELDIGIVTSPVADPDLLEIPLYHEKFVAYVSPDDPRASEEAIEFKHLFDKPLWVMRDGLRLLDKTSMKKMKGFSFDTMYEGGRVSILIRMVNSLGGMTIMPESMKNMILYSHHDRVKPIVNPVPERTIAMAIRKDYIHEKTLNVVVDAVKSLIPQDHLDPMVLGSEIRL